MPVAVAVLPPAVEPDATVARPPSAGVVWGVALAAAAAAAISAWLAYRVEAVGGELRVVSPVGSGTVLTAELPCAS